MGEPMLLSELSFNEKVLEDYKEWIGQVKENGVFGFVHIKNHKIVGIRNRENNPIFYLYPELEGVTFSFNEGILVAEIVVFKNNKSVFYGGIDHRRKRKVDTENPVTLVIHDILKLDDKIVVMLPYKERYGLLQANIKDEMFVKLAINYSPTELWELVVKNDLEGLVLKNPLAPYEIACRSKNYIKIKNYKTAEMVVDKVEENPKGTKVYGKSLINENEIDCEVQIGGKFNITAGEIIRIKYLDMCGNRLIQPTKV